ncbi:hypothetical protein NVP1063O_151 [Vibrio phage 1.063.O._10N.261.45.C7]|nr:hypothetical protein NVP1063O_151 [Vibrio phage 1.063.O._10N.261.45.C7]
MKQPKFNIGDSFETTYLPEGKNYTLMIDGINYTKKEYTFVSCDPFNTTAIFSWDRLEKGLLSGRFIEVNSDFPEELPQEEDEEGYH